MNNKLCVGCGDPIHPKRLEILPNAIKCVACSTTGKKAAITVTKGEGDHTYNETVIMDREEFNRIQEMEYKINGKRKDSISHPDEDESEEATDTTPIAE
jgi:hypothetical protein